MRWTLRGQKIGPVTGDAFGAHPHEHAVRRAAVTTLTQHAGMRAEQWKTIRMIARHRLRRRSPGLHRVALLAAIAHLRAMQIGMAGRALARNLLEHRIFVARLAGHTGVHAFQRIRRVGVVVELRMRADRLPRRGRMATLAGDLQRSMWIARALLRGLRVQGRNENGKKQERAA